jgi:hypothetical protein
MEKGMNMVRRVVAKLKHYVKKGLKLYRAPWAVKRLKNDLFGNLEFVLSRVDSLLLGAVASLELQHKFVQELSQADAERQKQLLRQFQALAERIDRLEEIARRNEEQIDALFQLLQESPAQGTVQLQRAA